MRFQQLAHPPGHAFGHVAPDHLRPQSEPALFPLGEVTITRAVFEHLARHDLDPEIGLHRHARGDWGDVSPPDATTNDQAVARGGRILSRYRLAGKSVWVITEANRAVTTLLFPAEY